MRAMMTIDGKPYGLRICQNFQLGENLIKSTLETTAEDEHLDQCKIVRSTMMNYAFEYCRC